MIVVLYPDDLVHNFKGNERKPNIEDFPAIKNATFGPFDVILYKNGKDEVMLKSAQEEIENTVKLEDINDRGLKSAMIMLPAHETDVRLALTSAVEEISDKIEKGEKWEEARMGILTHDNILNEEAALEAFRKGTFKAAWVLFHS